MFGANVGTIPFDNVMLDSTKLGYKLQSSQYQDKGEIAIIDQGDSDICGYTKRLDHNPFDEECIIFGDHTERFKHIVVPFYSGADGVKILTTDTNEWNYTFLYYYLDIHYHPIGGYSRHFKFLKELTFLQPEMKLQNQFADFVKQVDKSKSEILEGIKRLKLQQIAEQ